MFTSTLGTQPCCVNITNILVTMNFSYCYMGFVIVLNFSTLYGAYKICKQYIRLIKKSRMDVFYRMRHLEVLIDSIALSKF